MSLEYQVSARKYRPGVFDEVVGQPHVVQTLANAISSKRIAHAFLFSGTRGVGKTTVARILAKSLNCEQGPTDSPCNRCINCGEITQGNSVDVIEIDGASNTSVDDVREIRENIKFAPFRGQYRVYIIDEVHMLSNSAFNALLKTLEEPPAHVVFIFATTEIHKIPATILSRCQHYNFRRIAKAEIAARLRLVAERDKLQIEDRSLLTLARASEGSMRDALSLLDQVVAFGGASIRHEDLEVLLGAVPHQMVRAMAEAVLSQQSAQALRIIAEVLNQGHDVKTYCADLVEYIRNLLIAAVVPSTDEIKTLIEASEEDLRQLQRDAARMPPEHLQELLTIFTQAEDALRLSAHPRFVLEAAAVRATRLARSRPSPNLGDVPPRQQSRERSDQARPSSPSPAMAASSSSIPKNSGSASQSRSVVPPLNNRIDGRDGADMTSTGSLPNGSEDERAQPDDQVSRPIDGTSRPTPAPASTPMVEAAQERTAVAVAPRTLEWHAFQEAVSLEYPHIAPFMEMGRFLGFEDDQVLIGFSKQATSGRAMMEKPDNMAALALLGERLVGRTVRVRIVELTEVHDRGPTMKELRMAKQAEERQSLLQQARAHPLVKQALELFGGELAEVSARSLPQEVQE